MDAGQVGQVVERWLGAEHPKFSPRQREELSDFTNEQLSVLLGGPEQSDEVLLAAGIPEDKLKRLRKRHRAVGAIAEAEANGAYDAVEAQSSDLPV